MRRIALLSLTLLACACARSPDYVVRYDLAELATETARRDASPGFTALPESATPRA